MSIWKQQYQVSTHSIQESTENKVLKIKSRMETLEKVTKYNESINDPILRALIAKERSDIKKDIDTLVQVYHVNIFDIYSSLDLELLRNQILNERKQTQEREQMVGESDIVDVVDENNLVVQSKHKNLVTDEERGKYKIVSDKKERKQLAKEKAIYQLMQMLKGKKAVEKLKEKNKSPEVNKQYNSDEPKRQPLEDSQQESKSESDSSNIPEERKEEKREERKRKESKSEDHKQESKIVITRTQKDGFDLIHIGNIKLTTTENMLVRKTTFDTLTKSTIKNTDNKKIKISYDKGIVNIANITDVDQFINHLEGTKSKYLIPYIK